MSDIDNNLSENSSQNPIEALNTTSVSDLNSPDIVPVLTDQSFNQVELGNFDRLSIESLKKRDQSYSAILTNYQEYVSSILSANPKRQTVFFIVSIVFLIASPLQFLICLCVFGNSENLVPLLASLIEVISSLLVFPKIIAEYLFNTNETTSINDIVAAIQEYDLAIRSGIRHTVESNIEKNVQKSSPSSQEDEQLQ